MDSYNDFIDNLPDDNGNFDKVLKSNIDMDFVMKMKTEVNDWFKHKPITKVTNEFDTKCYKQDYSNDDERYYCIYKNSYKFAFVKCPHNKIESLIKDLYKYQVSSNTIFSYCELEFFTCDELIKDNEHSFKEYKEQKH